MRNFKSVAPTDLTFFIHLTFCMYTITNSPDIQHKLGKSIVLMLTQLDRSSISVLGILSCQCRHIILLALSLKVPKK